MSPSVLANRVPVDERSDPIGAGRGLRRHRNPTSGRVHIEGVPTATQRYGREVLRVAGRPSRLEWVVLVVVTVGVAVRLRQLLSGRSLWVDEAAVALDLADFGVVEALTQASPRQQMAPVGFLVVSNAADAISSAEWMLRLFPFLSGVVLVAAAAWYAVRRLVHPVAQLALVVLVSFSPSLIHYSAELKQYEVEALLAFVAIVAATERRSLGRAWVAVLGIVMLTFSITRRGRPRSRNRSTTRRTTRRAVSHAIGRRSSGSRWREKAIAGKPWRQASIAAATVPE